MNRDVEKWYNDSYGKAGIKAQRRYPNEELCRFMGRNFFDVDEGGGGRERQTTRILELGCGSCANLWMIAKEGFDAYGCDISEQGIEIGHKMLEQWGVTANVNLTVCDMTATPYQNSFFDAVLDVFSSYCLCEKDYLRLLAELKRILKPGGKLFSYFPSKNSDTYKRSRPADRIDRNTVNGLQDKRSPFYGNDYPFRFMSGEDVRSLLPSAGFSLTRMETCGRTYDSGQEYWEFIVFEAVRNEMD